MVDDDTIEFTSYKGDSTEIYIPERIGKKKVARLGDGLFSTEKVLYNQKKRNILKNITSVVIPDGVTAIGNEAFNYCSSLKSITIPDGVISIGESAFRECANLISVNIPNSVTVIPERAFNNCWNLTNITIPNSVISIEKCAFSGCTSLTNITISNSVTHINHYAFYNCHKLTINAPAGSYAEKYAKKKIFHLLWKNKTKLQGVIL